MKEGVPSGTLSSACSVWDCLPKNFDENRAVGEFFDNVGPVRVDRKHGSPLLGRKVLRDGSRWFFVRAEADGKYCSPRDERAIRVKETVYACCQDLMASSWD